MDRMPSKIKEKCQANISLLKNNTPKILMERFSPEKAKPAMTIHFTTRALKGTIMTVIGFIILGREDLYSTAQNLSDFIGIGGKS